LRSVRSQVVSSLAHLAVGIGGLSAGACSEATPQPPALGDCTLQHDASCRMFAGGGGGGSTKGQPESGADVDAADLGEPVDATTACGQQADRALAQQTPACAACVGAGQDAGSMSCCTDELACSQDPSGGCVAILGCAILCAAGASCSIQSCGGALYSAASVVLYNTLAQCMASVCGSPLCPMLSTISPGD
jgi:hypothetical protein